MVTKKDWFVNEPDCSKDAGTAALIQIVAFLDHLNEFAITRKPIFLNYFTYRQFGY